MREGKIILPVEDNDRNPLDGVHVVMADKIVDMFGGVTVHEAIGHWKSDDGILFKERVKVYTVAAETAIALLPLIGIAKKYAAMAKQEAVYVAVDGNAEIITL